MSLLLASARIELLRLVRSGLGMGLFLVFVFFGLAGPALALSMPSILQAATSSEQLSFQAAPATAHDGIALFNQSAMQLGLILAVAVSITSLGWDARPGSSIFYRTRVRHLMRLTLPRLIVGWIAVVSSFLVALAAAATLTIVSIGQPEPEVILSVAVASSFYLVMAMSIGHLIMTLTRRTATALAIGAVLMLALPLLNAVDAVAAVAPTALLNASQLGLAKLGIPLTLSVLVSAGCVFTANFAATRQRLRRDA